MSRILVIDDELAVCDSIRRVLESSGHTVFSAADGNTGLELCRSHAFDLVISDVIMPGTHGIQVIEKLREEFPKIRIIAISGGGNLAVAGYQPDAIKTAAYMAAAAEAGADTCLTKPFSRSELIDEVTRLTH